MCMSADLWNWRNVHLPIVLAQAKKCPAQQQIQCSMSDQMYSISQPDVTVWCKVVSAQLSNRMVPRAAGHDIL